MSDITATDWAIAGSDGQPIYGNTHQPAGQAKGVLICCHGFKGYKDYGFFPILCDQATKQGLLAVRFNFSHSGMTNQIETFARPDLFEKDTWGRQVQDLKTVLGHVIDSTGLPAVLFGHSRGGVTSTLYSGNNQNPRVAGLITAAAPDYTCKMDGLVKDQLRAEGRLLSPSGRTGQKLYVGLDWLEEIERDPQRFDPLRAAAGVGCPMLILHGDQDETVPSSCAHHLHQAASDNSRIAIIQGANHVFNCSNPVPASTGLNQLPAATQELIMKSIELALRCCS